MSAIESGGAPRAAEAPGAPAERGRLFEPLVIVCAAVLPFLPGVTSPFTEWDDPYYVSRSQRLTVPGLEGLRALWTFEYSLRDTQIEFFPLRDSVYWAIWQVFGDNPLPFHLVNVAFHAVACLLVAVVARRLGLPRGVALIGALLFATHPVHTESVVWVSGLKDPMFLSAMLGSLACYLRYRETLRPHLYGFSLVLLAAALACKSLALPTVVLMVVAERLIGTPTAWRLIALRAVGPLALTALSLIHIVAVGKANGVISGPHGGTWSSHWLLMSWALVRYVQQALVPVNFRLYYCFTPAEGLADPRLWVALLTFAGLLAAGVWLFRRDRRLGFLFLWFFICLGPVANILPFPALMADRYLYSPTVAVSLLAAIGLSRVRWSQAVSAAVVVTLGLVTATRSNTWQREEDLWNEVAEGTTCWKDDSLLALNALLQWALTQSEPERAVTAFRAAADHPAFKKSRGEYSCDRFIRSSVRNPLPDPKLELKAAELMVYYCPHDPKAWERLALDTWHSRPDIAARATERAYLESPITFRRWRLGLARINANDARGKADIRNALLREPEAICVSFLKWVQTLPEARRAEYDELIALCPAK